MTADPLTDGDYRLVLDRETMTCQVLRPNHPPLIEPMTGISPFGETSYISRTTYYPAKNHLEVRTIRGDTIHAEIPTSQNLAPHRSRPTVYLDQNHWNTLYRAKYVITGVKSTEQVAALWMIEQAEAGRIILPISSAHMSETCKWTNGGERYTLALTMLQLSAGWQLRDPLMVRQTELLSSMRTRLQTGFEISNLPVVTLEPSAIASELRTSKVDPKRTPLILAALTTLVANYDTMLDGEAVQQNPVTGWVERNQNFTDWLATQKAVGQEQLARKRTYVFFFSDSSTEIAKAASRAGVPPEEMSHWTREFLEGDLLTMPNMGLYREVFHDKLVDRHTKWNSNDLTDMMYLTCAASYCDFTVGEKSLTSKIEQAQRRMGRPVTAYRKLSTCAPGLAARINQEYP